MWVEEITLLFIVTLEYIALYVVRPITYNETNKSPTVLCERLLKLLLSMLISKNRIVIASIIYLE